MRHCRECLPGRSAKFSFPPSAESAPVQDRACRNSVTSSLCCSVILIHGQEYVKIMENLGGWLMDVNKMRDRLSVACKNGMGFILAATVIWIGITIIFMQPWDIKEKNIGMLWATGMMFPLALLFSKLIKAEWKVTDNPINQLGLVANLAQLMYFPILFWALAKSPEQMLLFFAIITGAHFFPYGWVYNTRAYYVLAPVISITILIIGWDVGADSLWRIPLMIVLYFLILNVWLWVDYKKKSEMNAR